MHAQPPEQKPGSIALTFVDSVTKNPVKGASVAIRNIDSAGPPVSGTTGESGEAQFTDLAPGRYFFSSVMAKGYVFERLIQQREAMVLRSEENLKFGPIEIVPTGSVSGTVLDADGKPIARATVDVLNLASGSPLGARNMAITDAAGQYRIEGISPGRAYVRVLWNSGLGIPTVYYPNGTNPDQALRIDVPAGAEAARIDFHIRRSTVLHIRGSVAGVDSPGKGQLGIAPCANADKADVTLGRPVTVGRDGSFDVGVVAGDYCVAYRLNREGGKIAHFAQTVVRVADRDIQDIRIVPAEPGELTGIVKLEKDAGLSMPPFVSLLPADRNLPQPEPGQVQPDGSFRITGVLPVGYGLFMTNGGGYIKSARLGGAEVTDGRVNFESGGGPLLIDVAAARGRAKVTVNVGSATPAQTLVVLMAASSAGFRSDLLKIVSANDQGEVAFTGVAPGLYKAYAFADPDKERLNVPAFLDLFPSSSVRIADGEERTIELRLIPRREFDEAKERF